MHLLAVLAVLVTLLVPTPAMAESRVTAFSLRSPGDIVVPVTIDGQGPFRMLLDTGASRSAVTAAVADRLVSRKVGETVMVTPAGRARRGLLLLKGMRVGGVGPQSVVGVRLEPGDVGNPGIDGLIGQDLLSRAAFTIDHAAGTIAWHRPGDQTPAGVRVSLELLDGRLIARLPGPHGELRLIVDSGADRLVLFPRARLRLSALTVTGSGALRSAAGTRAITAVRLDRLTVGDLQLRGLTAALRDEAAHDALEDGLLPLHLFSRVTLDVAARHLVVQK